MRQSPQNTILLQKSVGVLFGYDAAGEGEAELHPSFWTIESGDSTAVKLYGVLHYGKPKTGTARITAATFVHSIETLEKVRQTLGRNSGTVVLD